MNWKTTCAFSSALLMGTAIVAASGLTSAPAYAAPAITIENKDKALADAINGAQADAKAGRYADALTKAKAADALPGKPAALVPQIHQMIVAYAIQAKDYAAALAQIDKMIAANEGNKAQNLKQALSVSIQMNSKAKMNEYAAQLGSNLDPETRLFIAGSMMNAGQYKEALAEAEPLLQSGQPSEAVLKFEQAVYFKMNDPVGRRAMLEQLVTYYPKAEYWHDLLQLARNEKGLNDEQTMEIYRLRLAVGDMKSYDDYQEMAQQALITRYPAEAKAVMDKAAAAKLVTGERAARLVKTINDTIAQDAAVQADLQKKAATDPNSGIKLGLIYWTYGKNNEAEAAIRKAMSGKLSDPDWAKVALGHVLFSEGKKADAVAAFNSVAKNSKEASIARLWSIYARKG
jgi:tetratricopeptide (TPR) repeat protein